MFFLFACLPYTKQKMKQGLTRRFKKRERERKCLFRNVFIGSFVDSGWFVMRVNFVFRFVNDILTKWNSIAPCWPAFESQKGFFWNRNWTLWLTRLGRGDEYSVIRMMWVLFFVSNQKKGFLSVSNVWFADWQTGRQTNFSDQLKKSWISFFFFAELLWLWKKHFFQMELDWQTSRLKFEFKF